jgi:clan AA aspartic protease (TIGR02281 family)
MYHLGLSNEAMFWFDLALAGFVPYIVLLIIADRMLTIRKGFALLSIVVIVTWAAAATGLPPALAAYMPARAIAAFGTLPFQKQAALIVGALVLMVHLRPLWLGLRDHGEVATRLVEGPDVLAARRDVDPYLRNAADFRNWRSEDQSDAIMSGHRESSGLQLLFGIAWVSVLLAVGLGYYHATSTNVAIAPIVMPGVRGSQPAASSSMHPAAMPASESALEVTPETMSTDENAIAMPGLPTVQRPSVSVGSSWASSNSSGGPNEAVATRARDGSFGFDAVVNGAHVPMLFDTGATVVALRAEDVGRFGITVPNLNYSAKVKTANGTADAAPIIIDTLTVGNITQRHVLGYVAKEGVLPRNLLGQSFLARLSGYNVENNQLVLRGR